MHEAGIMAGILELAEETSKGRPISVIGLRIGEFTTVVREALDFAFESLRPGTAAWEARLDVEVVPLIGFCEDCGWTGKPREDFCLVCPTCASPVQVLSGRELEVAYIDLVEQEAPVACAS